MGWEFLVRALPCGVRVSARMVTYEMPKKGKQVKKFGFRKFGYCQQCEKWRHVQQMPGGGFLCALCRSTGAVSKRVPKTG